jgi:hypothetical protein
MKIALGIGFVVVGFAALLAILYFRYGVMWFIPTK